jgi:hypothetical protein
VEQNTIMQVKKLERRAHVRKERLAKPEDVIAGGTQQTGSACWLRGLTLHPAGVRELHPSVQGAAMTTEAGRCCSVCGKPVRYRYCGDECRLEAKAARTQARRPLKDHICECRFCGKQFAVGRPRTRGLGATGRMTKPTDLAARFDVSGGGTKVCADIPEPGSDRPRHLSQVPEADNSAVPF